VIEFLEKPGVVIVLLVALVVFGAKRLPDSARALGRSMRILKAEAKGLHDDGTPVADPAATAATAAPTPTPTPTAALPTAPPPVTQPPAATSPVAEPTDQRPT